MSDWPTLVGLLAWVLPLSLVSALSPMMFLQSSALMVQRGADAALKYCLGQGTILAVIAPIGIGVMGNIAETWVEREIASKRVSAVLGLLLFAFAAWVIGRSGVRRRKRPPGTSAFTFPDRGPYLFGLLNGASDYAGIIVFGAIAQRTGAAEIAWYAKIVVVLSSAVIILIPAWLPVLLARVGRNDRLVTRVGPILSRIALLGTIVSSLVGGTILIVHSLI